MFVVWKRPDGYHDATPEDFKVVTLENRARIWLHKTDRSWYPFRIAGGWQESEATQRLNGLINLLGDDESERLENLRHTFHNSMSDDSGVFVTEQVKWLTELENHLKGDTWEIDIMGQVLQEVSSCIEAALPKLGSLEPATRK